MATPTGTFTDAQLLERRQSIGASEAWDVVCGRWRKLWLRKTGRDTPDEDTDDTIFGRMMEGAVLDRYEQLMGCEVERQRHFTRLGQPTMTATPDGAVWPPAMVRDVARGNPERLVEVKCPRYTTGWGDPNNGGRVPARVWWQVQQQLACAGATCADVAMLAHRAVRIYRDILPHAEAIELLAKEIAWGWQTYIEPDVMPPPDESAECAEHLARLYPEAGPERQVMEVEDAEVAEAARAYEAARRAADEAEAAKRTARAKLVGRIGSAYGLAGTWGQATYGNVAGRKRVDWDALCIDVLRSAGYEDDAARAKVRELSEKHTAQHPGFRRLEVKLHEG